MVKEIEKVHTFFSFLALTGNTTDASGPPFLSSVSQNQPYIPHHRGLVKREDSPHEGKFILNSREVMWFWWLRDRSTWNDAGSALLG